MHESSYVENYKPIKSNPWLALQAAKRHFREIADNGATLLDNLCSTSVDEQVTIASTVVGASGRMYKFSKASNSTNLDIGVLGLNDAGDNYVSEVDTIVENFFINDGLQNVSSIITNGLSISSIMMDINNGVQFNECLSGLCNAFQASNNLTYSDVSSILTERLQSSNADVRILLDTIKSMLRDGKLNSYSWLSLLSNLLSTTSDQLDSGSTLLDTSKPFIIQSMVSYFFSEVLSLVVSSIALLIKNGIGLIIYAVYSLLSTVFNYLKQSAITTALTVDSESTTDYTKGPVFIGQTAHSNLTASHFNDLVEDSDGIVFVPSGPIHTFTWSDYNGDNANNSSLYSNGFLSVSWNWRKAIEFYASWFAPLAANPIDLTQSNVSTYLMGIGFHASNADTYFVPLMDKDYYLSTDEVEAILSDPKETAYHLYMSLIIYNAITQYAPNVYSKTGFNWISFPTRVQPVYGDINSSSPATVEISYAHRFPWFKGSTANNTPYSADQCAGYRIPSNGEFKPEYNQYVLGNMLWDFYAAAWTPLDIEEYLFGNNQSFPRHIKNDVFEAASESKMNEFLQSFYSYIYSSSNGSVIYKTQYISGNEWYFPDASQGNSPVYALDAINGWTETSVRVCWTSDGNRGRFSSFAYWFVHQLHFWRGVDTGMDYPITYKVDSLPTDRAVMIASTTTDQILNAILLVATVTTAIISVTAITKRWRQARANKRKTAYARKLTEARELYDADPNDPEVAAYFNSEVRKYNLKASIFGWGYYDVANNWFDAPVTPTESLLAASLLSNGGIPSLIPSMINKSVDSLVIGATPSGENPPTLNSLDALMQDNNITLTDIKKLISG